MAGIEPVTAALVGESSTLELAAALRAVDRAFGLAGGVAMLSTAERFAFGRMDGPRIHGADGAELRLDDVFEARIFTPEVELRWLADQAGGRAAVLHEGPDLRLDEPWLVERIGDLAGTPMRVTYLLWGSPEREADGLAEGWCWLAEARVGRMAVPHPVVGDDRLVLVAREYVGVDARHGNAHVVAERLLQIAPAGTGRTG